jgi:hypothetical protein
MAVVAVLHQKPARHLPEGQPPRARVGQGPGGQQAQVLLGGKDRARASSAPGAMTTSVKISTIAFRRRGVQRLVQRDDPAEGRGAVAVIGAR